MAKVGFWLKGSTGKLAGATMYKDATSGETIMREVVSPTNPKTEKQIIQRIVMHTVSAAYSLVKEICDHSFEGMKAGRETMGYFIKQNVQFCREQVAAMQEQATDFYSMYNFLPLGMRGFVCNQYQLAMGSLPRVNAVIVPDETAYGKIANVTTNTYQAIIDALGLKRGDQLTLMMIGNVTGSQSQEFRFARIILDPTDPTTHLQLPLDTPFVSGGIVNAPSVRNEGSIKFANDFTSGLQFYSAANFHLQGVACIVSRQVNEDWLRSTTYLSYRDNQDYSLGECIDRAANGVATPIYAPSEYYLNNAGEGGGAAAEATQGGGSEQAVNVTSVAVAGNAITQGQTNTISGTPTNPVSVIVNLSDEVEGTAKIVKVSDNSVIGQQAFSNGAAIISASGYAQNVDYRLVVNYGGEDVATGFQFKWVGGDEEIPDGD